jgi:hypothetical protein
LREDIYLEWAGIAADEVEVKLSERDHPPGLDDNGIEYRRLYFVRASLKTLVEVQETLHALNSISEYRGLLGANPEVRAEVTSYHKKLKRSLRDLQRIRNSLGGHVSQDALAEALCDVNGLSQKGKFEIGRTHRETHYGFTHTLCAQVFLLGVPQKDWEDFIGKMIMLNDNTLHILSSILAIYLDGKGYFNR